MGQQLVLLYSPLGSRFPADVFAPYTREVIGGKLRDGRQTVNRGNFYQT